MIRVAALLLSLWSASLSAQDASLQLVGEARLKFLFWSVYDSSLYSKDGRYREGQRPLRLDIHYLRDISAGDLVAQTAAEWEHQGLAHERQQQWLQRLARLWPDVRANDVLSLALDESGNCVFYYNGELLGTFEDPDFGNSFLAIWLSPNTSQPRLRLALIGQQ